MVCIHPAFPAIDRMFPNLDHASPFRSPDHRTPLSLQFAGLWARLLPPSSQARCRASSMDGDQKPAADGWGERVEGDHGQPRRAAYTDPSRSSQHRLRLATARLSPRLPIRAGTLLMCDIAPRIAGNPANHLRQPVRLAASGLLRGSAIVSLQPTIRTNPEHLSGPLIEGLKIFTTMGCFLGRLRTLDSVSLDPKVQEVHFHTNTQFCHI